MFIYAMSDIHGEKEAFEDALSVVDFSDGNMLVLCGDYLDRKHEHPEFLTYIKDYQESHQDQVVVLMGNHEAWYLEEILDDFDPIFEDDSDEVFYMGNPEAVILHDRETLTWLRALPLYYETDTQIYVHAGVDEDAGEYWRVGAEDYVFYEKFPPSFGSWLISKDIIAGHVGTYQMCGEHRVFWDGQSHFYIDGTTEVSKFVPVLKFDTETGQYTSFEKVDFGADIPRWSEYVVKHGSR